MFVMHLGIMEHSRAKQTTYAAEAIRVGDDRHHSWCRATPISDNDSISQLLEVLKLSKFVPELFLISIEVPARL